MRRKLSGSEEKKVKMSDGTYIFYEVHIIPDPKETLVFLHGLGGDLTAWDEERKAFHELGYATIAVDLRGHGLSDRPADEASYHLNIFVSDILAVLDHEKVKHPILLGHCLGGMITLLIEGTHQKTARALVLIDTSCKPPYFGQVLGHHVLLNKIISLIAAHVPDIRTPGHVDFSQFVGTGDFNARRILSDVLHTSLRSYLYICEHLVEYDATRLLHNITVSTLVIDGTDDSIFPPKVAKDLAHRIKHATIDLIEGVNHILIINNPNDLIQDIISYLKKLHK